MDPDEYYSILIKYKIPGKNFKLEGFGVSWVCINIDLKI